MTQVLKPFRCVYHLLFCCCCCCW